MSPSSMVRRRSGLYVPRGGGASGFDAAVLALSNVLVYAKCSEAAGSNTGGSTTMVDSSGSGHDGTWHGDTSVLTLGTAGLISGESDTSATLGAAIGTNRPYAEVAPGAWADVSHFSVVALVKTTASVTSQIIDRHNQAVNNGFQFRMESNGTVAFYLISGGGVLGSFAQTSVAVNDGIEHLVIGTCDGTNLKIYTDGGSPVSVANANGQPSTGGADGLRLGVTKGSGGLSNLYVGVLEKCAYIGSAITATDVANLWAAA